MNFLFCVERAFSVADDVLRQGVVGISEIIIRPGLINVDFADVRTIMGDAGTALMGIGRGSGRNRSDLFPRPIFIDYLQPKQIVFNSSSGLFILRMEYLS